MILEIAEIHIRPGEEAAFEEALGRALHTITAHAEGVKGFLLSKCVETPQRYVLHVTWETLEHHTVIYAENPARETWRAMVRPFFEGTPTMAHFTVVTSL